MQNYSNNNNKSNNHVASSEITPQSVVGAIEAFYQSQNNNERKQADLFLGKIRDSENGFLICCKLFCTNLNSHVLFYCLHVFENVIVHRWNNLSKDQILKLNKLIFDFIIQVCAKRNMDNHIKQKLAQIIVLLMVKQYLDNWPQFLDDFMKLLKYGIAVWDIFFRFLKDLNWFIVENHENTNPLQMEMNTKIKDQMRDNDLSKIIEFCYSILERDEINNPSYKSQSNEAQCLFDTFEKITNPNIDNLNGMIIIECLETLDKYISWIDIKYSFNNRFLKLLYQFLAMPQFRRQSVDCLYEIVNKRMSSNKKIEIIENMNILHVIEWTSKSHIATKDINDFDTIEYAKKVSGLIEVVGVQLCSCWHDQELKANTLACQAYKLALPYFTHPDFEVQNECIRFILEFWNTMNHRNEHREKMGDMIKENERGNENWEDNKNNERSEILSLLMKEEKSNMDEIFSFYSRTVEIILSNLCFPNNYTIEDGSGKSDEYETEFDCYREDLDKVIKSMTRVAPNEMLKLINIRLNDIVKQLSNGNVRWQIIESALHMVYRITEDYQKGTNIDDLIRQNNGFAQLFEIIVNSKIINSVSYTKIGLKFFDIVVRYCAYFEKDASKMRDIIEIFVDKRGIRCDNAQVRARSTYLLCKFITKMCSLRSISRYLSQCAPTLVNALAQCCQIYINERSTLAKACLQARNKENFNDNDNKNNNKKNNNNSNNFQYSKDDVKSLCHSIGMLTLLESTNEARNHAQSLAQLFVKELNFFKNCKNLWIENNSALVGSIMADYISCLQSFSKAYSFRYEFVVSIFGDCTNIILSCYACIPDHSELRAQSICFLHSTQDVLRSKIVAYLPNAFNIFIKYLNEANCVSTLQVFTNMVANVGTSMNVVLDEYLWPFLEKLFDILNKMGFTSKSQIGQGQEFNARIDVQKHYYGFIAKIIQVNCHQVLVSSRNECHLEAIMNTILDACQPSDVLTVQINRQCFMLLKQMVSTFGNSHGGLTKVFLTKAIALSFEFPMHSSFDVNDSNYNRTLTRHIFGLQKELFAKVGKNETRNAISQYLIQCMNVSSQDALTYCQLAMQGKEKQLKKIVLELRCKRYCQR